MSSDRAVIEKRDAEIIRLKIEVGRLLAENSEQIDRAEIMEHEATCLAGEVRELRAFVRVDYDSYPPRNPYAVKLAIRFPWLIKAAEAAGGSE